MFGFIGVILYERDSYRYDKPAKRGYGKDSFPFFIFFERLNPIIEKEVSY